MNLKENEIISLVRKAFGEVKEYSGSQEIAVWCPFCSADKHKKKLQINLNTHQWHCWICQDTNKSKGRNLFSLFNKAGKLNTYRQELETLYSEAFSSSRNYSTSINIEEVTLPAEFIPLNDSLSSIDAINALHYLYNRGLSYYDVLKYRIGYCESGDYKNRVIIPSYDSENNLNYWVSRIFYEHSNIQSYIKAPVSSNVVGFESLVNWKYPVTIVEGPFDAFAVRRNVIPLFGKAFMSNLKYKILYEKPPIVNIALDTDAIKNSIRIIESLLDNGITTRLIQLDKKDPSEEGFGNITQMINSTRHNVDFSDLIEYKLYD